MSPATLQTQPKGTEPMNEDTKAKLKELARRSYELTRRIHAAEDASTPNVLNSDMWECECIAKDIAKEADALRNE